MFSLSAAQPLRLRLDSGIVLHLLKRLCMRTRICLAVLRRVPQFWSSRAPHGSRASRSEPDWACASACCGARSVIAMFKVWLICNHQKAKQQPTGRGSSGGRRWNTGICMTVAEAGAINRLQSMAAAATRSCYNICALWVAENLGCIT